MADDCAVGVYAKNGKESKMQISFVYQQLKLEKLFISRPKILKKSNLLALCAHIESKI